MRTTLDLDRDLIERARKALGTGTLTETIETALKDAVTRAESRRAWDAVIGSNRSWKSVEELLSFRREHGGRAL